MNQRAWPGGQEPRSGEIDVDRPSSARVYDVLLGGKDNYKVDRDFVAELPASARTLLRRLAWDNREFLGRAVRYLVTEAGVRQFLDIGTGLPIGENVHEVAQRHAPESRVVYVDNDPVVLVHARALLTSTLEGVTDYIDADARDTASILDRAGQAGLDFSQPVGLLLVALLHFFPGGEAEAVVAPFREALAPGSYLVISHGVDRPEVADLAAAYQDKLGVGAPRSPGQIAGLFGGWPVVEPGLVALPDWRPDQPWPDRSGAGLVLGGIARKPRGWANGPGPGGAR